MPLKLPTSPGPATLKPRLLTARNDLRPAFGGQTQRLSRLGSKWAIDVTLAAMTNAQSLAWSDLFEEVDRVVLALPQPGIDVGAPGTPLVAGGSQTGAAVVVDGVTDGYVLVRG
ncbi:MAG: hypothetical protein KA105_09835 [Caulobacter sp.]|nr:hypothetical protein [Caulobacter sp.]